MPEITIQTNVSSDKIASDLQEIVVELVSQHLNKPKANICVTVLTDLWMSFGESEEPCACCTVTSIVDFNAETCEKLAALLMPPLQKALGVSGTRFYLQFHEITAGIMGFQGTTVKVVRERKQSS
uniref:Macrophage migration inhibitory factor n=1 Tax=Ciona intestinalis TaxID=7719 RepID=H2Y234_CIOIN|nr:macrophage migration inhibitory factor-like [Ciona intestinalis]|eukprot:XP_002120886.1 macrophage migration inhibitory factor-like [Ciona intestinalis]